MGTRADYDYGNSKYLKAEDMVGKTTVVVISDVEDVQFDDKGTKPKPVLSFKNRDKALVVNATNFDTLAAGIGNNTNKWPGHSIVLKGAKVGFKGRLVDSIVVEVPKQAPKPPEPEFDDATPFEP
jgi:hypothetical protein